MRLSVCSCSALFFLQVLFQRFIHVSTIFRHTYVEIIPSYGLSLPAYQSHVLTCKASYLGEAPDVEWIKRTGIRLENNPRFRVEVTYNPYDTEVISRLTFLNALPGDSGTYSCRMLPSASGTAEVPVKFWTEPTIRPTIDVTLQPGLEQSLACHVQGGFEGTMLWSKDGHYIGYDGSFDTDGDRLPDVRVSSQALSSHSLTVLNARASDAGVYDCRFRYKSGNKWKSIASRINVFAGVDLKSDSYILWQGDQTTPLQVKCLASGYPLPTVTWSYTAKKISLYSGSWDGNISIYDRQITHVQRQSVLTIAKMPGFFNITKFNCKGENRISTRSNTIMVVNVGTTLIPGSRASCTQTGNSLLLLVVTISTEILRRNMR